MADEAKLQKEYEKNLADATKASGDEELARQFAEAAKFMSSLKNREPKVNLSQSELLEVRSAESWPREHHMGLTECPSALRAF